MERGSLTLNGVLVVMPSEMSLLDGINSLRSVRKFKPDPIPEDKLKIVLESASKAASGSNTQPWEFVVVRDAKVKARLKEPMLRTWLARLAGGTGMSPRMRDVYDEATEMLRNTEKVHGSTSTRGEPEVKKILGIPEHVKIACLIYLGYPAVRLGRPRRKPVEKFVHNNRW